MNKAQQRTRDVQAELMESAHRIWLAGLGAVATAGEEGKQLFDTLVKKGEGYEEQGRKRVEEVRDRVKEARESVTAGFDERVAAALHRFGVPTRDEIANLSQRVEELTRTIARMNVKEAAPAAKEPVTPVKPTVTTKEPAVKDKGPEKVV
jgi:poly(hydroxyalkanoate) granule-associated protein